MGFLYIITFLIPPSPPNPPPYSTAPVPASTNTLPVLCWCSSASVHIAGWCAPAHRKAPPVYSDWYLLFVSSFLNLFVAALHDNMHSFCQQTAVYSTRSNASLLFNTNHKHSLLLFIYTPLGVWLSTKKKRTNLSSKICTLPLLYFCIFSSVSCKNSFSIYTGLFFPCT